MEPWIQATFLAQNRANEWSFTVQFLLLGRKISCHLRQVNL
uniref:Uncharacterized protein n=1 Tax=Rhizophora mucronata TaxID=61149 RepID=A0A2P2R4Y4_RHIMU